MNKYLYTIILLVAFIPTKAERIILGNLDSNSLNIIDGNNYRPGDTLVISKSSIAGIRFKNLRGTQYSPIVIINMDGQVLISEERYDGIKFSDCKHVHLCGTGVASITYGFSILEAGRNTSGNGISISDFSTDIEVDHVEIRQTGFTGIMAKTDPTCENPKTWRRNGFILKNLHLHHNYIHNTEGEGMYIGYTGGYKIESTRKCDGKTVFGHWIEDLNIHHNRLENIGWDGIQVNLGRKNCYVHHNYIRNYGTARKEFHNFGMSIGAGVYEIFNNSIIQSNTQAPITSSAVQLISTDSGTKLFNNVINNAGGHAFFIHSRHKYASSVGISVVHNTIVGTGSSGILYNSSIQTSNDPDEVGQDQLDVPFICKNNLITNTGTSYQNDNTWKGLNENYIDFNSTEMRDAMKQYAGGNYFSTNVHELVLTNPSLRDFSIMNVSSPAYDVGEDLTADGYSFDFKNYPRTLGERPDAGAYEYKASGTVCISGFVIDHKGAPVTDAKIKGFPNVVKTNKYGMFSKVVDNYWSETLSPEFQDYTFSPESETVPSKNVDPAPFFFVAVPPKPTAIDKIDEKAFVMYPNPCTDGNFYVNFPAQGTHFLRIIDLKGRIAQEQTTTGKSIKIKINKTGLYVLQVFKNTSLIGTQKIVIQ